MKLYEQLPSLNGATATLNGTINRDELLGKAIFIHFWATSCQLCKNAMPNINKLRDEYEDSLQVISIHVPRCEEDLDISLVKEMIKKYDIKQITLIDNEHAIKEAFDNKCVPAYYLFDKEGKLRHYQAGGNSMVMLGKRLIRLSEEAKNK
ncbi:MAG: TlpA family protein disulfide reductase [Bacillaceae bacterium]